jgi:hypothetical protein
MTVDFDPCIWVAILKHFSRGDRSIKVAVIAIEDK